MSAEVHDERPVATPDAVGPYRTPFAIARCANCTEMVLHVLDRDGVLVERGFWWHAYTGSARCP